MKRIKWFPVKIFILALVAVLMVAGVTACGKSTITTTSPITTTTTTSTATTTTSSATTTAPPTAYQLTHSAEDAEYILNWDFIVSKCPDIGAYDRIEAFLHRGESKQSATGETTTTMEMNSQAAWMSMRSVFTSSAGGDNFRGFSVYIAYCETAEYLDEYIELMKMSGIPFQEDGGFITAVLESGPPTQSIQLHIAGNQFYMLFLCTASSNESLFCDKDTLEELIAIAKSNITSLEITPLPADIPDRILTEDQTHQWQELMTVRSDELAPATRVSEEEFYNDLWFVKRPFMQVFNFTIDKGWRFVMTATGEIGTRFEVYATIKSLEDQEKSYSTDQVFSLYSETLTFTREQPLEEGYAPPVNVEVKVNFNLPLNWVITIEK